MALHYDTTRVQEKVSSGDLNYLIYATVVIGIPEITEQNWKEFYLSLIHI